MIKEHSWAFTRTDGVRGLDREPRTERFKSTVSHEIRGGPRLERDSNDTPKPYEMEPPGRLRNASNEHTNSTGETRAKIWQIANEVWAKRRSTGNNPRLRTSNTHEGRETGQRQN